MREASSSFDLLHPAVQHHVVNSLGWHQLRRHQEAAIAPILAGEHVLVQAPTAGGKTESAILPLLSRMLTESWQPLSVLYLCPIKALLNNLETRLERLTGLVGRRTGLWHGDVSQGARQRLLSDTPDLLLTTPESVEVMLVSRLVDHGRLFGSLQAVVVDEVHAFAGDDRGWHLLSLLERVSALAAAPVQRIALSATLSNAPAILDWFTARREEPRQVVRASHSAPADADVQVDYVGSLDNAATVISRLHVGEKRLIFCDSRSQVEELAQALRAREVRTFVSHSSLALDERRRAEEAFAQDTDCVIVATSTLELGIDVGDLDRVIQVDAPYRVSSFLQRLGRTGRRPGSRRNCLFLATDHETLLRAVGLVLLWEEGFVEPVVPPPLPAHVLAQQVLAIVLQESGADHPTLASRLDGFARTAGFGPSDLDDLLSFMLGEGMLFADGPILGVGKKGEEHYGRRHFLELFSVFNTPPLVTVFHGAEEVGRVHPLTFQRAPDGQPTFLALGGRGWKVTQLDWRRGCAWVEPDAQRAKSRWLGGGPPLGYEVAQAVRRVLTGGGNVECWSKRTETAMASLRGEYSWLTPDSLPVVVYEADDGVRWWTFAGDRWNGAVARWLDAAGVRCVSDGLGIELPDASRATRELLDQLEAGRRSLATPLEQMKPPDLRDVLKFAECVPSALLRRMAQMRFAPGEERALLGLARLTPVQIAV